MVLRRAGRGEPPAAGECERAEASCHASSCSRGDPVDARRICETERNLRRHAFIRDARVTPTRVTNEAVRARVEVFDAWSITGAVNLRSGSAVVGVFVRAVFATLRRRAAWDGIAGGRRLLERWRRDDAGWISDAPTTGALAAASVGNTIALGGRPGQPTV